MMFKKESPNDIPAEGGAEAGGPVETPNPDAGQAASHSDCIAIPREGYDLFCGDAASVLQRMPAHCAQCIATSPPYYGLRDYRAADQIGREPTVDAYIERLATVFLELRRVLAADGVCWVVIGEKYRNGMSLRLSDRLIDAMTKDGWLFVSRNIWFKPNPLPENVSKRPAQSHEYLLQFVQSAVYKCDFRPLRVQAKTMPHSHGGGRHAIIEGSGARDAAARQSKRIWAKDGKRAFRSVLTVQIQPCPVPHVAAYPEELILPAVLSSCSSNDLVLDPFVGSGTTGIVALRSGRRFVGIDVNGSYCAMARERIDRALMVPTNGGER